VRVHGDKNLGIVTEALKATVFSIGQIEADYGEAHPFDRWIVPRLHRAMFLVRLLPSLSADPFRFSVLAQSPFTSDRNAARVGA